MKRQVVLHSPDDATTGETVPDDEWHLAEYVEQAFQIGTMPRRQDDLFPPLLARRAVDEARRAEACLAEQARQIAHLERLASTDPLTGLLNRRGFENAFRHALAEARRYGEHGILVYIDLDGFKSLNDTYGHAAGDEILRQVGRILGANVRDTDYVGRMGGDEFPVLMTRSARHGGLTRADHLDRLSNDTNVTWEGRTLELSASLGVYAYTPADDGDEILKRADQAMYEIKRLRAENSVARVSM